MGVDIMVYIVDMNGAIIHWAMWGLLIPQEKVNNVDTKANS
jgi:hypothetical protein